jgi:hypothetical protein
VFRRFGSRFVFCVGFSDDDLVMSFEETDDETIAFQWLDKKPSYFLRSDAAILLALSFVYASGVRVDEPFIESDGWGTNAFVLLLLDACPDVAALRVRRERGKVGTTQQKIGFCIEGEGKHDGVVLNPDAAIWVVLQRSSLGIHFMCRQRDGKRVFQWDNMNPRSPRAINCR